MLYLTNLLDVGAVILIDLICTPTTVTGIHALAQFLLLGVFVILPKILRVCSLKILFFYLSHGRFFSHSFNWPMARLMLYDTAVLLFLTAERADERLDAVINRVPSLDCKNRPLSRTDCQRDWMNEFSRSASKRITTWRRLFTRI